MKNFFNKFAITILILITIFKNVNNTGKDELYRYNESNNNLKFLSDEATCVCDYPGYCSQYGSDNYKNCQYVDFCTEYKNPDNPQCCQNTFCQNSSDFFLRNPTQCLLNCTKKQEGLCSNWDDNFNFCNFNAIKMCVYLDAECNVEKPQLSVDELKCVEKVRDITDYLDRIDEYLQCLVGM